MDPKPYPKNIKVKSNGLPSIFYIETALACNLRCPECFIGVGSNDRKKSIMKIEDFKQIWGKIADAAELAFFFLWGEPTLNKNIAEFVKIAARDAHIQINTNGTLLDVDMLTSLYDNGLGTLMYSIDGVTQKTYEKYRVGGDCETAWNSLEMAAKIHKERKSKTDLFAAIIAFKHNEEEIDEFVRRCDKLGVRSIVRPPYVRYGSIDQPTNKKYQHPYSETEEDQLKLIAKCHHLIDTMTIGVGGETLLCTQDYSNEFDLPTLLDNDTTLESIWDSDHFRRLRSKIRDLETVPSICKGCVHFPVKK